MARSVPATGRFDDLHVPPRDADALPGPEPAAAGHCSRIMFMDSSFEWCCSSPKRCRDGFNRRADIGLSGDDGRLESHFSIHWVAPDVTYSNVINQSRQAELFLVSIVRIASLTECPPFQSGTPSHQR